MSQRRVVITGMGVITPLGDSRQELHESLCNGRSGIRRVDHFDDPVLDNPLVGEIASFDPATYLGERNFRPLDRTSQLLASAAQLALDDSGWTQEMREERAVGLVAGTVFCSVHTISEFDRRAMMEGPSHASPLDFANTVINAAAGQTAIWHKLRGVNSTISTGITSGLAAIAKAAGLIREGHEQAILAGGVEELCVESLLGFQQAGLLSKADGSAAPVPFQSSRPGFALAEGAALLMLEEYGAARARVATILAEVKGQGASFDCTHDESDDAACGIRATCVERSINAALTDAQLGPSAIDAVSASANGNHFLDRCEVLGIQRTFNGRSGAMPVTALKSMLGESLGAGAAIQAVDMIETLRDGHLPGVHGFQPENKSFPLQSVSSACRTIEPKNCLVNSVGLDGNCCALVLGL